MPDLYLAVQNMSEAPVRLADTAAGPKSRSLKLKLDGRLMGVITTGDVTGADVTLRPREVVFLKVFPPGEKNADGRTGSPFLVEELLKDPHESFVAELKIEKAPAGAWAGTLVTGEANGAAAQGKPQPNDKRARALFDRWQRDARATATSPAAWSASSPTK